MRSGRPWGVLKGDDRARHDLARHLRGLVDHSELTLKAVGGRCGCSDTTVSKQLAGDQLPPWGFVEAVVDACTPDERRRPERRRAAKELWQRAARARRVDLPPAEPGLVDAHTRLVRAQEETIATQRRLIEVTDELSTARRQLLESVQVEHRSSQAIMVLRIVLVRLSALLSRLTSERDRYLAEATRHQAELERTRRELSDTERQRGRARDQLDQAKGERQRASALTELLHDKVNDLEGRLRRSGVTPPDPGTDAVVAPEPGPSTPDEILLDTAAGLDRLQRLLDAHGAELAELESVAAGERPPARPDPDPLPVLLGALSPDVLGPGDPNTDTGDGRTESDKWQAIAEHVRERFGADRAVLRVRADTQAPMRTFVAGEPLPPGMRRDDPRALREDEMLQLPGTRVRRFGAVGASPGVAEALARRDAREALVAPIRGVSQLLGAVEVHDRSGEGRGFDEGHIDSLRSLARHLSLVVDNRRLLARLRHDAYHDPLTGLLNRPGFREAATEPMRQAETAVVLRIDLDVLSTVSDALGQAWANRMVVAAGRRLRDELGPEVPLARLEGGAFAVLLLDRQAGCVQEIAERLRAALSMPYPVDRLTVEAGAVVGWATTADAETGEPDVDALLQRAEVALLTTSENEPLRQYAPSMGQIFLRRFQLVTQFRSALESGQISVHYQPKVALPSRQVVGAEALVRWKHPEFGRVDPDEFVPAVEATGLVDVLTDFVMDKALHRVRRWLDRGLRMSIAVNLSVRTLADAEFPDRVAAALTRHDVPPELLTFELTESGVMADPERALPVLRRLHTMGVVLAVDDFGTGYSSLAYLRQLPVDEVKIDKSFVLGMGTDLGDMAVVRSIVELGHSLGLTVVAEGVEDDAARDQLVGMGCDIAQGYLISRPLSEDRFEAWLRARTVQVRTAGRIVVLFDGRDGGSRGD